MFTLPTRPFYMIRHGETTANAEGFAAGAEDVPLTERGWQQAEAARGCFENLPILPSILIHSGLGRARDTAQVMNKNRHLPTAVAPDLAEQSYGDWAYQPWDDVRHRIDAGEVPPNGESIPMFDGRVARGLRRVLSLQHDWPCLVLHGGIYWAFGRFYGLQFEDVRNCALYAFLPVSGAFPWSIVHYVEREDGLVAEPVTPVPLDDRFNKIVSCETYQSAINRT